MYQDDALTQRYLVTSSQTAFEIEYLLELSSLVDYCSANFEGLAKSYNRLHNAKLQTDLMQRRVELCRKRMTEGYFLYAYLEVGQHYEIPNYQIICGNLNNTILIQQEKLHH